MPVRSSERAPAVRTQFVLPCSVSHLQVPYSRREPGIAARMSGLLHSRDRWLNRSSISLRRLATRRLAMRVEKRAGTDAFDDGAVGWNDDAPDPGTGVERIDRAFEGGQLGDERGAVNTGCHILIRLSITAVGWAVSA